MLNLLQTVSQMVHLENLKCNPEHLRYRFIILSSKIQHNEFFLFPCLIKYKIIPSIHIIRLLTPRRRSWTPSLTSLTCSVYIILYTLFGI